MPECVPNLLYPGTHPGMVHSCSETKPICPELVEMSSLVIPVGVLSHLKVVERDHRMCAAPVHIPGYQRQKHWHSFPTLPSVSSCCANFPWGDVNQLLLNAVRAATTGQVTIPHESSLVNESVYWACL